MLPFGSSLLPVLAITEEGADCRVLRLLLSCGHHLPHRLMKGSSAILRLQGSPNPHPDGLSQPSQPLCVPACGDMCEQHACVQLERCNSKILLQARP